MVGPTTQNQILSNRNHKRRLQANFTCQRIHEVIVNPATFATIGARPSIFKHLTCINSRRVASVATNATWLNAHGAQVTCAIQYKDIQIPVPKLTVRVVEIVKRLLLAHQRKVLAHFCKRHRFSPLFLASLR